MITEIVLLQLGETMNEGTIASWYKAEGDRVEKGEPLCGVETDKAVLDIEAPVAGYLAKILVPAGSSAPVLQTIGLIADQIGEVQESRATVGPNGSAGAVASSVEAESEEAPGVAPSPAAASAGSVALEEEAPLRITPAARRVAREHGIDPLSLRALKPSGPGGRVVEADVLRHVDALQRAATPATQPAPAAPIAQPPTPIAPTPRPVVTPPAQPIASVPAASQSGDFELIPLSRMRRIIAERLAQSYREAVHVTLEVEADMAEASKLRKQLSAEWEGKHGVKVTFTDLIVKAVAKALVEHPEVNSSFAEDGIRRHRRVGVGVAVAVEQGLIVPVVQDADSLPLLEISRKVRQLADTARLGQLGPDNLRGGTFTVTNMGMLGVDHFTPIINTGEGAILGVGRIADRPAVVDGALAIRPIVPLSLSFDHRLIDGASAAVFLARVKQILESPYLILI
jgi:pyruvate dehydrogenase E2 component (dihydrolipoamide acetyltransferase)